MNIEKTVNNSWKHFFMRFLCRSKIVNIFKFAKSHWLVLFCATAMSFLVILPQLLFPLLSGNDYRGLNIGNFGDDDIGYYSKAKDFLCGNGLGNYALSIGKDNPDPHGLYIDVILLSPLRLLDKISEYNIVTIYMIYQFVGIIALILLIYTFIIQLSGHKFLATATAIFVIGGYRFILLYPIMTAHFRVDINIYSRPVMPYLSSIVFFVFLNFLVKAIKTNKWNYAVLSGVVFGLSFYTYAYAWTFSIILLACLFFFYVLKRDKAILKKIFIIISTGIVIGIYTFIHISFLFQSEIGHQITFFFGVHSGRYFAPISKLAVLSFLLFIIFAIRNRDNKYSLLILSLILAGQIAMNQQLVTGKSVQVLHYFWYFIIPSIIVCNFYMLWVLCPERFKKRLAPGILFILIMLAFTHTAVVQYRVTEATFKYKQYAQQYKPIFDFLNKEDTRKVILISNRFYGHMVTVYTNHDLFWGNVGVFYTPIERFTDALYVYGYLNNKSRADFTSYIMNYDYDDESVINIGGQPTEMVSDIFFMLESYWYGQTYNVDNVAYSHLWAISDESVLKFRKNILAQLEQDFFDKKEKEKNDKVADILKEANVSYIIWDSELNPDWDLSNIPNLQKVASSNNVYLYKFIYSN